MLWRVLALVAAALVALPAANAELGLRVVAAPPEPIPPETATGDIVLDVSIDCQSALVAAPPVVAGTLPVQVMGATSDANVFVAGPGIVLLPTGPCLSGLDSVNATFTYRASANRGAVGLVDIVANFTARTQEARGYPGEEATAAAGFQVDYYPYIQARRGEGAVPVGPDGLVRVAVEVTNFGNAPTRVQLALADPASGRLSTEPHPVILNTPNGGGTGATATVEVLIEPAHGARDQAFAITATPFAAADSAKTGDPVTVSVMARSAAAPPAAALALAILAVAATLRRPLRS